MKTLISAIILITLSTATVFSKTQLQVAEHLQDISVTISSEDQYSRSEGSGVLIVREVEGEKVTFVLTCAHVVDNLRKVRKIIRGGQEMKVVEFSPVSIVKELVESGRKVGEVRMTADVIQYSDADTGEDLAVLMVHAKDYSKSTTEFLLTEDKPIIPIGTDLFHVGSLLGQFGSNSMTNGIMSQVGRVRNKVEFDQTTVTAFPGSSGGGVYLKDGTYIGMIVRGAGEGFNLIVPIRRITRWLDRNDMLWVIDPSVKVPTLKQIQDIPVEGAIDVDDDTRSINTELDRYPEMIRTLPHTTPIFEEK